MTPRERYLSDIGLIALRHGVTRQDVLGKSRLRNIVEARQHCYWHLRERGRTFPEIGRLMRRDHSSVIHGRRMHMLRNGIPDGTSLPATAGYSAGLL